MVKKSVEKSVKNRWKISGKIGGKNRWKNQWKNRVAKCQGYWGYIRVKMFAGWGKKFGRT